MSKTTNNDQVWASEERRQWIEKARLMLIEIQKDRASWWESAQMLIGYRGPDDARAFAIGHKMVTHFTKSREMIDLGLDWLACLLNPDLTDDQAMRSGIPAENLKAIEEFYAETLALGMLVRQWREEHPSGCSSKSK